MPRDSWYDVAQICLNGHVVNHSTQKYPQHSQPFCSVCGAASITTCHHCQTAIKGRYYVEGVGGFTSPYEAPAFCHYCGYAYPWTASALEAAQELADLELDEADAAIVKANLNDIVHDTPRTQVAALKVKKAFIKAGPAVLGMFRDIVVDVASEAAKKAMFGV